MSVWRRLSREKAGDGAALARFAAGIVEEAGQRPSCRLKISQYAELREALAGQLRQRGLDGSHLAALTAGRMVAVCPACQLRLSAEYLEWLHAADPLRAGSRAAQVARFRRGLCVNEECSASDIILYWHR